MINKFCKYPLWEVSKDLAHVAAGRIPATTVIQNATLVNVCTAELLPKIDVALVKGRIALVGDATHCIGEGTIVVDAKGAYLAPGFLDGHIHVESSMLTVSEYARTVLAHGTTGIFMDPHEICNVLGLSAVKLMLEEGMQTPLKAMLTTPSCVPAVQGFEDIGSKPVTAEDVAETMNWDGVVGLGEMMNFPGINFCADEVHGIVAATLKAGKIPTGHYSIPETGAGLNGYIAAGLRCCHESTRQEDALAKMRLGMYAMLREGSAWKDLHEVAKAITNNEVDSRYACLISDDAHPNTLLAEGHINHILKRAVEEGIDPVIAIQMVTINTAQCFQLDHDMGSVTPGKCADLVLLHDLTNFNVLKTWVDGDLVAQEGKTLVQMPSFTYPDWAKDTMHMGQNITTETFKISAENHENPVIRIIEVIAGKVGTHEKHIAMTPINNLLEASSEEDILKAFVFERHHATGKFGKGFVKGFGIKRGAMASTVAHDAHNLLVIGSNDADMELAANTLIASKGGMCVVLDGEILGHVALPIAGIMSDLPAEKIAKDVEQMETAWDILGCTMPSPFMTMALIPLACLPELRLTNRGLVDCTQFQFASLLVEDE